MDVLCVSSAVFWYYLPNLLPTTSWGTQLLRLTGTASMEAAFCLVATSHHDLAINPARGPVLVALIGAFVGRYHTREQILFRGGFVLLPLLALNSGIYYTRVGIFWLPPIQ